ncbi:hypothetical protein MKX01_028002, partial [Papaver californicum]
MDDTESDTVDASDVKEERKRDKDKDRKHRKRPQSGADNMSSEEEEKDESKKSRRHTSSRKKNQKSMHTRLIQTVKVGTRDIGKIIEMAPALMRSLKMENWERLG